MAVSVPIGDVQRQQTRHLNNSVQVWPQQQYCWPNYVPVPVASNEEYANDVEVIEGDHDVTLIFSRVTGRSKSQLKRIVLPKSLYDGLGAKAKKS